MHKNKFYIGQNIYFRNDRDQIDCPMIRKIGLLDDQIAYGFKIGKNNYVYRLESECFASQEELMGAEE